MDTILVVDDEINYLTVMETLLGEAGYEVLTAPNALEAVKIAGASDLDLVLTDMKMPKMSGIELLEKLQQLYPELPVIIMTAYGTVEKAVTAMKKGAFDYILKPFKNEEILVTIAKALEHRHLILKNRLLNQELEKKYGFPNIVGESRVMEEILALVKRVATSRATVLITGESGTGKELVARAIHQCSPRADKGCISVNCAALTETLLESELFGHERGAFTHAVAMRKGRFELADGGTSLWTKWRKCPRGFRSSSSGCSRKWNSNGWGAPAPSKWMSGWWPPPTGTSKRRWKPGASGRTCSIASTWSTSTSPPAPAPGRYPHAGRPLHQKVCPGKPPGQDPHHPGSLEGLISYAWPGNVRELENVMERAVILCSNNVISPSDLPGELAPAPSDSTLDIDRFIPLNIPLPQALDSIEEQMIRRALEKSGQIQVRAAELLGITKSLLQYKLKKYHLTT